MAKKKRITLASRIKSLQGKIEAKYGKYDDTLDEQVETTAMNRMMIDKMHEEIIEGSLSMIVVGSMGQQKTELNPLVAAYDKAQRTYIQQLAALGLNKFVVKKEESQAATNTDDEMRKFLSGFTKR